MASTSEANADFGQVETARRLSVDPTFLRALGLMKVTSEETTVTSVPLAKNAGGSHTSASKKLILPHKKRSKTKSVASSTAKKSYVVEKEHVLEPKDQAKKRSHATSFDEQYETRKSAAPATDKPTTKKHKELPPAMKASSSAPKSTIETAENLSELTGAAEDGHFWDEILESNFKSPKYTTLLRNNKFTEEQVQVIQKSMQYLSRLCRRPTKRELMTIQECIECYYSVSHDCVPYYSTEYWTCGSIDIDFIRPEAITMCRCHFTNFHSHSPKVKLKSKSEAESTVRSPLPSTLTMVENNHSAYFSCTRCDMKMSITTRNKDVCSIPINEIGSEDIRTSFMLLASDDLDFGPQYSLTTRDLYFCRNHCCMLFHPCIRPPFIT